MGLKSEADTRLSELLGIKYPIIGGAMAYLTNGEFAAAVSNADGLGLIAGISWDTKEELREQIRICRSLTDRPFGVNITLVHRSPDLINQCLDCCIEEGVQIVETVALSPEPYIKRLKEAGITVLHKCATLHHAQVAEKLGVDAVGLIGFEAAGATGSDDIPLSIMIPLAVDSIKVPVIACGGVGDGRAFVAALALGAAGVQIGTRFMATKECPVHPKFKELMIRSKVTDTVLVKRPILKSYRAIHNATADEVLEMEAKGASIEELLPKVSGEGMKKVIWDGDLDAGIVACGEVLGLINDIPSVKELIDRIMSEAEQIVERLHRAQV